MRPTVRPLPRCLFALAGLLLATVAMIVPASKAGAAGPEFFGMMTGGSYWNTDVGAWDGLEATGAKTVRFNLNWDANQPTVNCTTGQAGGYDFSGTDQAFKRAAVRGVRVLPTLYGNSCDSQMGFPQPGTPAESMWLDYIEASVDRYGIGGDFWKKPDGTPRTDIPILPPKAWEIWNEPNYSINNPGGTTVDPKAYARLMIDASNEIQAAQPGYSTGQYEILMGGLATFNAATSVPAYFFSMLNPPSLPDPNHYTVGEFRAAFSGLSLHPYALTKMGDDPDPTKEDAVGFIDEARDILDAGDMEDKTIWATEIGWPVGFFPWGPGGIDITPADQKNYLQQTFNWMLAHETSHKIKAGIWYNYRDSPTTEWENGRPKPILWDKFAGLVDSNGNRRPSWCAFANLTGANTCPKRPYALTSPSVDRDPTRGDSIIAYENIDQGISYWFGSKESGWFSRNLGGSVAGNTSPSVSRDPSTGRATIAYRTSDGKVGLWEKAGHGKPWTHQTLGSAGEIALNTSPDLARAGTQATNNLINNLVYRRANGDLVYWAEVPGSGWLGPFILDAGAIAQETSPKITREPANGITDIAFQTNSGQIKLVTYTTTFGWTKATFGAVGSVAAGSSPDVARNPNTGLVVIPYRNSSNKLAAWTLPPGSYFWAHDTTNTTMPPLSSPTVAIDLTHGNTMVAFRNNSNGLSTWDRSAGGTWSGPTTRGLLEVAYGSNPAANFAHDGASEDVMVPFIDQSPGFTLEMATGRTIGGSWINFRLIVNEVS